MNYDLIIVGGGPAGTSLAVRVAASGMQVLLLEKDVFPARSVVSCSLFLSHGMRLLDEIGVTEDLYALENIKLRGAALEVHDYFRTFVPMPDDDGRNYVYGIDREKLDTAIWERARQCPNVTAMDGFHVSDIRQRDGHVWVIGTRKGGEELEFTASRMVGADGRHSLVARKVGAATTHEVVEWNTAVFYAYWDGVKPYLCAGEPWVQIHTTGKGRSTVVMPSASGRTGILVQCRATDFHRDSDLKKWYTDFLHDLPKVAQRLEQAEIVTPIKGMKNVQNLFRTPAGAYWVLVGDAYHQKDSYDAQGIYDALFGAKVLSKHLHSWFSGDTTWEQAMHAYGEEVAQHMEPMFASTMERLKREMFTDVPPMAAKTAMRWMLTNRDYVDRFGESMIRKIDPMTWSTPGLLVRALLTGLFSDARALFLGTPKDGVN
ncbi:NAD(P)/FAD-dependent oxidoreductase [Sphingobacterium suaedae]|uniref:NAD(P)/FAD-dependent oxidoreductase n=1 Tax=Sphingobacterium suaedae TaxID=1686402 RepID=A0ABW5KFF0_9SPHI